MEGQVKWFNRSKSYGFVEGEDGQEYFVHSSALAEGTFLRENDRVSFDPAEGEKGKQAQNVVLLQKGSEIAEEAPAEEAAPEAEEAPEAEKDSEEEAPEAEKDSEEEAAPEEDAAPEAEKDSEEEAAPEEAPAEEAPEEEKKEE